MESRPPERLNLEVHMPHEFKTCLGNIVRFHLKTIDTVKHPWKHLVLMVPRSNPNTQFGIQRRKPHFTFASALLGTEWALPEPKRLLSTARCPQKIHEFVSNPNKSHLGGDRSQAQFFACAFL
jgi:hypothetical protein